MKRLIAFCVIAASLLLGGASNAQIQAVPPNVSPDPSLPMILLNMSKDYSMFSRAYTDYEDLDFDGVVDYTFKADFSYYGYFDPTKCYTYGSGYFSPGKLADVVTTTGTKTAYYCAAAGASSSTFWSGNFLNWATMSRMDVLRKILFGGLRSTDTSTQTILEMSFVSRNSQAFVKFYNGSDLVRLTPFNYSDGLTLCRRHAALGNSPSDAEKLSQTTTALPQIRAARGNYLLWNMTEVKTCNWDDESYTWKAPTVAFVTANYVGVGGTSTHATKTPVKATQGAAYGSVGPEYTARVEACVSTLVGTERCKQYPSGNLKPFGLLHEFGESNNYGALPARAEFALLMGSFDNNLSGGVLRKNMSEINDELIANTGQFNTASTARGIIYSINELSLYGYSLEGGSYSQTCYSNSISNGNCPSWGNPVSEILLEGLRYYAGKNAAFTAGTKDNDLGFPKPTWSDPMKATRTYAIVSPATTAKTRLDLYGKNVCRPLNMVTISSGVSTFDDDGMANFTTDLGSTDSAAIWTNKIGAQEGINGTTRLIGNNGTIDDGLCTGKTITALGSVKGLCPDAPNMRGTYLGAGATYFANTNRIRSDLTLPTDANVNALKVRQYAISMSGGSAQIKVPVPGSNPLRYVVLTPASQDTNTGSTTKLPGNMVDFKVLKRATDGTSGTFLVLWQHAALGEDQDQDMLGTIRYDITTVAGMPKLNVYTQTLESDTGSSTPFAFGYTVVGSGSNLDGVHFHSGINNYTYTDTYSVTPTWNSASEQTGTRSDISKCYLNDNGTTPNGWNYTSGPRLCVKIDLGGGMKYIKGETMVSYPMVGQADAVIQDPLWYVAKYGGFKDGKGLELTGTPNLAYKWDIKRADGVTCGGTSQPACSDGVPDNYFLARRPDLLETSLREVFLDIVQTSNSAPAVSRPDLRTNDFKYVAQFDSNDLHGELLAFKILPTGDFSPTANYSGDQQLTALSSSLRQIFTNVGVNGVPFTVSGISSGGTGSATYLASLGNTTQTSARIEYLRGDRSNERPNGLDFRARVKSILGGIVNSNPWIEDVPVANYFGTAFTGYSAYKTAQASRNRLLWVGANDGMLHAFKADDLTPVVSYVPGMLSSRLKDVTDAGITGVTAFMDGSPFTGDITTTVSGSQTWKTYLFSSLGRGGKGIFALDVTNTTSGLTQANASNIFQWQFSSTDDADLGYIISEGGVHPISAQASQIAMMNNGKFGVLFGNGVQSTNGKAALYIMFTDGPTSGGTWTAGTHYIKLVADTGTGNGLMQPFWLDTDGDGIADVIYAGDLKGNMWKFDVSSVNTSDWKVAYGKPLYSAKDQSNNALSITSNPVVQFHPMGGQVVVFGTGKSIVVNDFPLTAIQQRIYGIWDKPSYAATTSTIPSGLTELQTRTLQITSSNNLIQTKTSTIDWSTKKGWFMNIPYASGMVVSNPEYAKDGSKDIGIPLVFPADSGSSCNGGSLGVYLQISAITGLLNADVFGMGVPSGDGVTVGIVSPDQRFRLAEDSTARCGAGLTCQRIVGQTEDRTTKRNATNARIFWREIPGLRTSD